MKLKELSEKIGYPYFGDGEINVLGVRDLAFPTPISQDHLYYVISKKFANKNPNITQIQIVLTTIKMKSEFKNGILADEKDSKIALLKILGLFDNKPDWGIGISEKASIHPSAKIGQNVRIMDFVVVSENAIIGNNCVLHPHVVVEPGARIGDSTEIRSNTVIGYNCEIGKYCLIHSNTTIGADGFGFTDLAGVRYKIPQIGNVSIGNQVEIGAGCTIDRATIESTTIGDETKLDDQVHIAHNCRVGKYVYMAGTAGLAGGVCLEDGCMIGGQVAIAEHLTIKKGAMVMGLTGVTKDVDAGTMVFGTPARPATEMLRLSSLMGELPSIIKRLKALEER